MSKVMETNTDTALASHDLSITPSAASTLDSRESATNWRQLRALFRLYILQSTRIDSSGRRTGLSRNPLIQFAFSLTFMGLLFAANIRLCKDAATYLVVLFTSAFTMMALAIIPESYDVRQRTVELLHSKPVSHKTLAASNAAALLMYAGIIVCSFTAVPLVVTKYTFGISWVVIAGSFLLLLVGAFTVAILWLYLLLASAVFVNLDRLRSVAQFALVIVYMGSVVTSAVLFAWNVSDRLSITVNGRYWLKFWPPAWFASFMTSDFDAVTSLQRAGVVALIMLALWVSFKVDLRESYPALIEKLGQPDNQPVSRPLSVRALSLLRRLPLVGKRIVPPQAFATASAILTVGLRDEVLRLKAVAPMTILVLSFCAVMMDATYALGLVTFSGFMLTVEAVSVIRSCSQPGASWLFHAVPLDQSCLIRGIRLAVLARYFAPAAILGAICLFTTNPPALAAVMTLSYFWLTSLLISLHLAIAPTMPLSREVMRSSTIINMAVTTAVQLIGMMIYAVLSLAASAIGGAGVLIGVAGLICLAAIDYGCRRWAVDRLAAVEAQ